MGWFTMNELLHEFMIKKRQVGINFSNGHTFGVPVEVTDRYVVLRHEFKGKAILRYLPFDKIFCVEWSEDDS